MQQQEATEAPPPGAGIPRELAIQPRIRPPPGPVEYTDCQGIEEKHVQIDYDFSVFNLMEFWLTYLHLKLVGWVGCAARGCAQLTGEIR